MNKRLKKKMEKRQKELANLKDKTVSTVSKTVLPVVTKVEEVIAPVVSKVEEKITSTKTKAVVSSTRKAKLTKQTLPLDNALYPIFTTILAAEKKTATAVFNDLMAAEVSNFVAEDDITEVGEVLAAFAEAKLHVAKYYKSKTAVRPLTAKMVTDEKTRLKRFAEITALAEEITALPTTSEALNRSHLSVDLVADKASLVEQLNTIVSTYNEQLDDTIEKLSI
ncbi:hypothetical protein [Brochothrix thermosphacta]|uniref:hypothetical protein n=1 Tax=Brochothrix thermosphacta TaxID=2756 RepID=UPI0003E87789|nr:hypothetical protein [Brochothrix thermosphacta]EUJ36568.1 hypothetical protein BTHER_06886 [Brochothrix thermosphacta DSM 20171 = FSL F6-1036]ODJ51873.1 hypothetical protein BFR34_00335 [Brochothrix thermosphacta DSM 20171 = FSL F6-1036]